jgi:MerR family transcriptional regulator, aldehyde-responsive regulator
MHRNNSGIRDYDQLGLKRVEFVNRMRSAGLPVETFSEYMTVVKLGNMAVAARNEILKEQRDPASIRLQEL